MSSLSLRHTTSVHISLDQYAYAPDTIEFDLLILVVPPVTHLGHISAASIVFFIAFCEHCILIQARGKFSAFVRLNPRIVVESPLNISAVLISMEPDICILLVFTL